MTDDSSHMMSESHDAAADAIDVEVATEFCMQSTTFPDVDENRPHMALLLYGLVCVDLKGELLMPNSAALMGEHVHEPRLFTKGLDSFTAERTLPVPDPRSSIDLPLAYWNLKGYYASWTAIDASGNDIPTPRVPPTKRNHPDRHPWSDFRYVRDITSLTGLNLLASNKRGNPDLIASRVALPGGNLEVVPPYTRLGMMAEWRVVDHTGQETVGATTDSMLLTYQWPDAARAVRVDFVPIDESVTAAKPSVVLPFIENRLTLAVTHATAGKMPDHARLLDTRAFALLLEHGDINRYPIPEFRRGARGQRLADDFYPSMALSASDGHCDCAVAP
jgi:hypothetical protein